MAITLDITGFYYAIEVEKTDAIQTVLDVLEAARGKRAPNGGVLDFKSQNGQIKEIAVEYDNDSDPRSRQANLQGSKVRSRGRYVFNDDPLSPGNRIRSGGDVSGLLTWQYYIFDGDNKLLSGSQDGQRVIVAAGASNVGPPPIELQDGYRIVWRLVAIFGLADVIEANRQLLSQRLNPGETTFKSAVSVLESEGVLEQTFRE